jgi:hypothetical protein
VKNYPLKWPENTCELCKPDAKLRSEKGNSHLGEVPAV